jgi:transcriptional regulator with XRE-family HTH domain
MAAADRYKHDPENDPRPGDFANLMKTFRDHAGLSMNKAALRCDISPSRWQQIERGWESVRGRRIPASPSAEFVLAVADGFDQDQDDLLRVAGFDPEKVSREPRVGLPPTVLMESWPQLDQTEQKLVAGIIRKFVDNKSVVTGLDTPAETETAEDTEASSTVRPTAPPASEPHIIRSKSRN